MTMVVTEVRAGLDPPRVLGYLLPGRGGASFAPTASCGWKASLRKGL